MCHSISLFPSVQRYLYKNAGFGDLRGLPHLSEYPERFDVSNHFPLRLSLVSNALLLAYCCPGVWKPWDGANFIHRSHVFQILS